MNPQIKTIRAVRTIIGIAFLARNWQLNVTTNSRIVDCKNLQKPTQVSYDRKYDNAFIPIFKINCLPQKGYKRKLKSPPLLIQYGGYQVKIWENRSQVQCFQIVDIKCYMVRGQFLHGDLVMPFLDHIVHDICVAK